MHKIIQFSVFLFLLTNGMTYATVNFELTNKTSRPIWICGYADEDIFTGEETLDCERKILPGKSFVADISNGILELTIYLMDPRAKGGKGPYRYRTKPSANDKNKMLVWNYEQHPDVPLYPELKKHFIGLVKTKMNNNITSTELILDSYK
jgi:hypothetical protein